mgnify:FL=1
MKNINIPNFETIGGYVMLLDITKHDYTEEFKIPNNLYNKIITYYNMIKDLYKVYPKFNMYLFTKAFSYNLYLEANNFNTDNVDYNNICIASIAYNIIKYLRKSWEINKEDIKKVPYFHPEYINNRKTRLTRNYIYKYYTRKLTKAFLNKDKESENYYKVILDNLVLYDNLKNKYDRF